MQQWPRVGEPDSTELGDMTAMALQQCKVRISRHAVGNRGFSLALAYCAPRYSYSALLLQMIGGQGLKLAVNAISLWPVSALCYAFLFCGMGLSGWICAPACTDLSSAPVPP